MKGAKAKTKLLWVFIAVAVFLTVVGVWWWQKQAPYRVARAFLNALQEGDIQRIYRLSDPTERKLVKLTLENYQEAYETILSPYLRQWRWIGMRPHPAARQALRIESTLVVIVTFENRAGEKMRTILTVPWTDEGWRVRFGALIDDTFLRGKNLSVATKQEVLVRLLKAGFYAFLNQRGALIETAVALQELRAGR